MENFIENGERSSKLLITFPKSSEDHRLQLITINGAIFAVLHSPIESLGPISLHCEEWSLILLAPIKSQTNIFISAINIICLSEIVSETGDVNVRASNRLIKFADLFKSPEEVNEIGIVGEFQFDDDLWLSLFYYQLFDGIVTKVRSGNRGQIPQLQQQVLVAISSLADKIKGNINDLNIFKVLDIWNIPHLKE